MQNWTEKEGAGLEEKLQGLAVWEIGEGMGDTWSTVSYGGRVIHIEEDDADYTEDGEFTGYCKVFAAAAELGADPTAVYSVEDDEVLRLSEIEEGH